MNTTKYNKTSICHIFYKYLQTKTICLYYILAIWAVLLFYYTKGKLSHILQRTYSEEQIGNVQYDYFIGMFDLLDSSAVFLKILLWVLWE